jgi:hypothetical protein
MPNWARGRNGSGGGAPPATVVTTNAPGRKGGHRGSGAGKQQPVGPRVDSWLKRPQPGGPSGGKQGGNQQQQQGQQRESVARKVEYTGPDGDLAENLERDMLDSSPGIR